MDPRWNHINTIIHGTLYRIVRLNDGEGTAAIFTTDTDGNAYGAPPGAPYTWKGTTDLAHVETLAHHALK